MTKADFSQPIQRVCRYPLLLAELHKNTSATDDPAAEAAIQKVLYRLRETAQEINNATNDPLSRARIQRSWQLQDLLLFPDDAVCFLIPCLAINANEALAFVKLYTEITRSCKTVRRPIHDTPVSRGVTW